MPHPPRTRARLISATTIALIAWFALIVQLYLSLSIGGTLVNFFSYFTILTNLLVALLLTISLFAPHSLAARAPAQGAAALYIIIVGATYSLLLRQIWAPQGLQKIVDVLLHDAVPILYAIYWIVFLSRIPLRWINALHWLLYPLVYLIYSLLRGAFTGIYLYPFLDAQTLGYPRVAWHAALFLIVFLLLGALLIALTRRRSAGTQNKLAPL
ncbi:MAG: Pr6Pr family membrane protein [Acidobacteriaceae bacterium]